MRDRGKAERQSPISLVSYHKRGGKRKPLDYLFWQNRGAKNYPPTDLSMEIPWSLPQQADGGLGLKSPFFMLSKIEQILATSQSEKIVVFRRY